MDTVLEQADEWQEAARRLLADSSLLQSLDKFGQVEIVGSYKYGLMMSGDIDLYLIVAKPSKGLAKEVVNHLIDENWWQSVEYADWLNFRYPAFERLPKAYYIRLKTSTDKGRWKIDIWILDPEQFEEVSQKQIANNVSQNQKLAILKLKEARNNKLIEADAQKIYEAVINRGINTVEEFNSHYTK